MAKKIRRVRTFARTATKSQEKRLIENSKKLYKDPFHILPTYESNDCRRYFVKIRKRLEKVHRYRDDVDKLEKLSKKKGLDGALAGTLLLAKSEKAPYLAVVKFSTGSIVYAHRGKASKENLIAVQYFDDPVLRLLGIKDMAIKKGLHIYSWDKGFICTGFNASPPKEFVEFTLNKLGLENKDNAYVCKHIPFEKAKQKDFLDKYYLRIYWKSADRTIALCEDCAKTSKNTMFTISKYLLEPRLSEDFDVEVIAQVVKHKELQPQQETLFLDKYFSGDITDYDLIQKNVKNQKKSLQQSAEKLLILDGISYGSDVDKFLDAIKPNKYERAGLEYILNKIDEPLIISKTSSNKILEMYWDKYGKEIINSMIDDEKMAESFYNLDETPSSILEMTFDYKERQQILSQFPHYKSLPPLAKFADHIAKTYKTFGEKKALTEIKKRPNNPKGKAVAYAFLLAFGRGEDTKWQYTPMESEYGEFLKEYAKKLLKAKPNQYNKALQELLTASGSSEEIQ